jgi:DNA-binding LytR/AlgR family response regulator
MSQSPSAATKIQETFPHFKEAKPQKVIDIGSGLIRFELRKESFIWVHHDQIMFFRSADHYINALVQNGSDRKWIIHHSTLKEFLELLAMGNFIRLNRFYVVNRKHFSHIDFHKKLLFLVDGSSIPVTHRISSFIVETLRS